VIIVALVLTGLAALVHVYIFWLESLAWTGAARGVFGTSREEAEATRELAFNQGFYNLFLAILVAVGTLLIVADQRDAGVALVLAGAGSMVAAGAVLFLSSPDKRGAALKQAVLPLVGVVLLLVALAT
jgi:putative membrane protein